MGYPSEKDPLIKQEDQEEQEEQEEQEDQEEQEEQEETKKCYIIGKKNIFDLFQKNY